jgi:hypothetical protein
MAEPFVELLEKFLVELMFFPEHLIMLADLDRVRGKAITFLSNKMVKDLDARNPLPFFMVANLSTVLNYNEEKSLKAMLCYGALLAYEEIYKLWKMKKSISAESSDKRLLDLRNAILQNKTVKEDSSDSESDD